MSRTGIRRAWFGFSVEAPQVNFVSNSIGTVGAPTDANVGSSPIPPGLAINQLEHLQHSGLARTARPPARTTSRPTSSRKSRPIRVGATTKLFGLQRFFADEVSTLACANSWCQKVNFGWGVGGSALLPVIPKYLDLQGSVMTGQGTGRYGSSQLADVTIGPDGSLTAAADHCKFLRRRRRPSVARARRLRLLRPGTDPVPISGPSPPRKAVMATRRYVNNGCLNAGPGFRRRRLQHGDPRHACTANVQRTQEFTIGFWQNIYKGDVGRFTFGAQYEYVRSDGVPRPRDRRRERPTRV